MHQHIQASATSLIVAAKSLPMSAREGCTHALRVLSEIGLQPQPDEMLSMAIAQRILKPRAVIDVVTEQELADSALPGGHRDLAKALVDRGLFIDTGCGSRRPSMGPPISSS
jgi:hypothetical protein